MRIIINKKVLDSLRFEIFTNINKIPSMTPISHDTMGIFLFVDNTDGSNRITAYRRHSINFVSNTRFG